MQTATERFRSLLEKYTMYDSEAYPFIYEVLDYTLKNLLKTSTKEHINAYQLTKGFRLYAIEQFGCLAKIVLNEWGIEKTDDIGELVFQLVEYDLLGKQEHERREDFNSLYDFNKVFNLKPKLKLNSKINEWETKYVQKR